MKKIMQLYFVFVQIGLLTFGGGYAMLSLLQRELAEKRGWVSEEELTDYYAIGQCTPGIIAINTATFIGNKRNGVVGGIVATLGFVTPSIIIITVIAKFISNFSEIELVQSAFMGIRACVCALILVAIINLWKKSVVDVICLVIFAIVFLVTIITDISPIPIIISASFIGIVIKSIAEKRKGKAK